MLSMFTSGKNDLLRHISKMEAQGIKYDGVFYALRKIRRENENWKAVFKIQEDDGNPVFAFCLDFVTILRV